MSKQSGDRVRNFKPFDSRIRRYEGGFQWTFVAPMGDDYDRRNVVKLQFDRWWLSYLANDLRAVLRAEIDELERLRKLAKLEGFETPGGDSDGDR